MTDIRNYFKTVSSSNRKRTHEQIQDEKKNVTKAKIDEKSSRKKVIELPKETKTSKVTSDEPVEKRKRSENFKAYMNRGGPDAPGSKIIPDGEKNCLKDLTFVISGVLQSLERDECKRLIEKYSGRVTSAISGKTNYLITGRDCSEGKVAKAREMKIKIISEDDLLEMIQTKQGNEDETIDDQPSTSTTKVKRKTVTHSESITIPDTSIEDSDLLWVDKYKPKTIKHLIGQQGENSCVQKLIIWLRDWYKHHGQTDEIVKAKSSFNFNRNENPAMFKAALLSGPPGIGKTTAAQLVCQHLNYDYVEMNASDQRSKKSMLHVNSDTHDVRNMKKYVLIMDEVDGVSGNADRGGIQELISIIKRSRIPIICICNDRQHKKIRSLANYCYDLRFYRPTIQQIRAAMLTILHRETFTDIKHEILDEIIKSCNQDIRQTIHTLNLWTNQTDKLNIKASKMIEKSINNNPFDLCRLSFSDDLRNKSMTIKSDIFFNDYQLMPLLIQENYLRCQPIVFNKNNQQRKLTDIEHLNLISQAADSIALGDICSQIIFSKNENWGLLSYQAIFSTVAPCSYVRGNFRGMANFSSFFGQRSRKNKNERLLNEIEKHMCLKIQTANKQEFNLDYLPYLSRELIRPLKQTSNDNRIEQCIQLLDEYYLNRDDFQTILELNTWNKISTDQLDTQTKSSLTRIYNKTVHRTPYQIIDIKKLKKTKHFLDNQLDDDEDDDDDQSSDDNTIEHDAMIKLSKTVRKKK